MVASFNFANTRLTGHLYAQAPPAGVPENLWLWILLGIGLIILLIFLVIFFSFIRLWIQSFLTGAKVGLVDMIRMKLCNVDYGKVVRWKIPLVQAGAKGNRGGGQLPGAVPLVMANCRAVSVVR